MSVTDQIAARNAQVLAAPMPKPVAATNPIPRPLAETNPLPPPLIVRIKSEHKVDTHA